MSDDFSNLRNQKGPFFQSTEDGVASKQNNRKKSAMKMRFIITQKKNSSWIEDLHAQTNRDQFNQVYH